MSDFSNLEPEAGANLPEHSVSELSQAIKRTLEGRFERVRVRGEISGFKRAASGHLYMALKDEKAVLDAVCWRGLAGRLTVVPEDGLEVVATGRITSYPGRSKYQIVIESLELAGEGALLKLLEERRKKLAAEGLFDPERKRPLPFLPEVIGVVTSPTGAVIRDILHRLSDRFPRRVLVWPVLVQGEGAAAQVAAAIEGFNRLEPTDPVPRPDLIIVARGGGSLEDLWAFNEEVVVRAAAGSGIPLISAVGHETDTTLIDHAADWRAPTPTAAAEMAVPVRGELVSQTRDLDRRLTAAAGRLVAEQRTQVEGLSRGLPDPVRLMEELVQRLDERSERMSNGVKTWLRARSQDVARLSAALPDPGRQLAFAEERVSGLSERLGALGQRLAEPQIQALGKLDASRRLGRTMAQGLNDRATMLQGLERVLESTSYHKVLARGFAVVRGPDGLLSGPEGVAPGLALDIEFAQDRHLPAVAGKTGAKPTTPARKTPARRPAKDDPQGSLL
jgi:exodeoxyribonuclease VII large subunit